MQALDEVIDGLHNLSIEAGKPTTKEQMHSHLDSLEERFLELVDKIRNLTFPSAAWMKKHRIIRPWPDVAKPLVKEMFAGLHLLLDGRIGVGFLLEFNLRKTCDIVARDNAALSCKLSQMVADCLDQMTNWNRELVFILVAEADLLRVPWK